MAHGGEQAVVLDSVGFLTSAGLLFGRRRICLVRAPITERAQEFHPKSRNDVLHQLDERAQHRAQQELGERWRADLVCACSYRCHGWDYIAGPGPGRFWRALPYKIRSEDFEFVGEGFSPSYEFGTALSPNSRISADILLPRAGERQRLLLVERPRLGGGLVSPERSVPHLSRVC